MQDINLELWKEQEEAKEYANNTSIQCDLQSSTLETKNRLVILAVWYFN